MSRIAVIGLGNPLMGDDGFGPAVIEYLLAMHEFDPDVRVVELGTPGPGLCAEVLDVEHLIVIDTVTGTAPPGTVHCIRGADLSRTPHAPRLSPHEPALGDALALAALAGRAPEQVTVIGVVPQRVTLNIGLSDVVETAVVTAAARVCEEIKREGVFREHVRGEQLPIETGGRSTDA